MGALIGPILNEGTEAEFRAELTRRIRRFIHNRHPPLNVDVETVERHLIRRLLRTRKGQTTLSGIGVEPTGSSKEWLRGMAPWRAIRDAQKEHSLVLENLPKNSRADIPKSILSHSMASVCGTLCLVPSADISELRSALGPVRAVSERHTQRIIKFLHEQTDWVHKHKSLLGREAPRSLLRERHRAVSMTVLAIWPLKEAIKKWVEDNPNTHFRFAMGQIVKSGQFPSAINDTLARISLLGSGADEGSAPSGPNDLVTWWQGSA